MTPSTKPHQTKFDLSTAKHVVSNPSVDELIAACVEEDQCKRISNGAVVAYSGKYTGRTPKDKCVVREPGSENQIWWDNNNEISEERFEYTRSKFQDYAAGRKLYVIDTYGGADPAYRIKVRFIVERAYHALFIKQLLIRLTAEELASFEPDWTVVDFGKMPMDPATDGTRSDAIIALNFASKEVLVAGTEYAGEMKKSVFTVMNYLLPMQGVLSMHCSANIGRDGDTALFFGLSGTGKTTLSTDPERALIGDDEHGWSDEGVFNIEGGCYAKCIRLSQEGEPDIWNAIRPGSILENVVLRADSTPDYDDASYTENTRVAYPLEYIDHAVSPSIGGHPKNIVFLTCDALGILPPISRLSSEQAMTFFLQGYTAKVAGTELGVTQPSVTFSTCFALPFLPLPPSAYAKLLGEKIDRHKAKVWLVNTGWTGGPYGIGSRMKLAYTRAMLHAAFAGQLDDVEYVADPVFGMGVPTSCPGVPAELLIPRNTWADPELYDLKAQELKGLFDDSSKAAREP